MGIDGIKAALLYETLGKEAANGPAQLAGAIKALPVKLLKARPIDEAISSAGGVCFEAMNAQLKLITTNLSTAPIFCAGEMLNWEAPTGGYLLNACLATGRTAGLGVLEYLEHLQR